LKQICGFWEIFWLCGDEFNFKDNFGQRKNGSTLNFPNNGIIVNSGMSLLIRLLISQDPGILF
jgi:hypothetical protein